MFHIKHKFYSKKKGTTPSPALSISTPVVTSEFYDHVTCKRGIQILSERGSIAIDNESESDNDNVKKTNRRSAGTYPSFDTKPLNHKHSTTSEPRRRVANVHDITRSDSSSSGEYGDSFEDPSSKFRKSLCEFYGLNKSKNEGDNPHEAYGSHEKGKYSDDPWESITEERGPPYNLDCLPDPVMDDDIPSDDDILLNILKDAERLTLSNADKVKEHIYDNWPL